MSKNKMKTQITLKWYVVSTWRMLVVVVHLAHAPLSLQLSLAALCCGLW